MIDIMTKGGIIMWPILLCAIISFGVMLERSIVIYRSRIPKTSFLNEIKENLRGSFPYKAIALCDSLEGPVPLLVKEIVKKLEEKKHTVTEPEIQHILDRVSLDQTPRLEQNMVILAIIGYSATLLGLLGTVQGMIMAFMKVQQMGGVVNAGELAGGIWTALITTFAGLSVAIPTIIGYNYLANYINRIVHHMNAVATEMYSFITSQFEKENKDEK